MSRTISEMSALVPTWPRVRAVRGLLDGSQRYPRCGKGVGGGSQNALWNRLVDAGVMHTDGRDYWVTDLGKDWLARVSWQFPKAAQNG